MQYGGTLGYTAVGERFTMGPGGSEFPPNEADKEFQVGFSNLASDLLANGSISAHSKDLRTGGLQGVLEGIDDLRNGRVSGKKLVYQIGQ